MMRNSKSTGHDTLVSIRPLWIAREQASARSATANEPALEAR
jgi:hypothetical protein